MTTEGLQPVPDDIEFCPTIRGFVQGQQVFARYTLDRVVGRGGMGLVWVARDEHLQEAVALKFLPELVRLDAISTEELKRETRRSRRLAHPNIVKVYDFTSDATTAAISMEFVDGETLSGLRARKENLHFEVDEIRPWLRQLLGALTYAHEDAKVVHRDLKPANIMVDTSGRVKVTDFGIASSLGESVTRLTQQRGASGTLGYMSPQQAMGSAPSASDDIYSLGATLYELLTGKAPFFRGDILAQLREVVPSPMAQRRAELGLTGDSIPAAWEAAIAACLAKEPEGRPRSIAEIAELLDLGSTTSSRFIPVVAPREALPPLPPMSIPPPPPTTSLPPPLERSPKRKSNALFIGAIVLVAVVLLGLCLYAGIERSRPAQADLADQAASQLKKDPETVPESDPPDKTGQTNADATTTAISKTTPLDELQRRADAGEAAAQAELGYRLRNADGMPKDDGAALGWFQKSAGQGYANGELNLGIMTYEGIGLPPDAGQAAKLFQQAADQGDSAAQVWLGTLYESGEGVDKDPQKAFNLYLDAAKQGNPAGEHCAGSMYATGSGVNKDENQAFDWIKKSADQGYVAAETTLGTMYLQGIGTAAKPDLALESFQKAATANDADAQLDLGNMYENGIGMDKDLDTAVRYYQQAAAQGNTAAADALKRLGKPLQ